MIGQFHKRYPQVTIRLHEDGAKKVEDDVETGLLDIGMVVLPVNTAKLHCFTFVEEKLNLILPVGHRLAEADLVPLSELAEEEFVLFREDFTLHDRIITECVKAGFQPKVIYESSQWDLISRMVVSWNGNRIAARNHLPGYGSFTIGRCAFDGSGNSVATCYGVA